MSIEYKCDMCHEIIKERRHRVQLLSINEICSECLQVLKMTVTLVQAGPYKEHLTNVYRQAAFCNYVKEII